MEGITGVLEVLTQYGDFGMSVMLLVVVLRQQNTIDRLTKKTNQLIRNNGQDPDDY